MLALGIWLWLRIDQGLRRFWSMFPLRRGPFWNSGLLSHSHLCARLQAAYSGQVDSLRTELIGAKAHRIRGSRCWGRRVGPDSRALLPFLFWGRVPLLKQTTEERVPLF